MSNNLYNILAAFNAATKPAEEAKADIKKQAKAIYESVEAKGSIIGGVKGVEKKLSEAFAKHKVDEAEERHSQGNDANYMKWWKANCPNKPDSEAKKAYAQHLRNKYKNHPANTEVAEGKMSDLDYELKAKEVSDAEFKKKYGKSKADMRKSMSSKKDEKKTVKEGAEGAWVFSGMGHFMQSKAPKVFAKCGLTVVGEDYVADEDIQEYTVTGPQDKLDAAEGILERSDHFGGVYPASDVGGMDEAAGDDIQWYDRPDDGDTTQDTETGRIHRAGRGGYGNKVDDEAPMAIPAGQVARGRGRPKNLAGELKRKAAAERLAANGGVRQGRGRPRKAPAAGAGEPNSAPQGTLGLHRFLFGPTPTSDNLPGKPGVKHKIRDTGTVKNPNAPADEFDEGMEDFFANAAKKIPGAIVRQGSATSPRKAAPAAKPAVARKPADPRQQDWVGGLGNGPEEWYNQSTGGKRNMGDSKINRKAAVSEGKRPSNFKGYLAEGLGAGQDAMEHIQNRFKHEVKQFQSGGEMDNDLYEALFDYYLNSGEMPYGIAKARTGDPYDWVCQRFEQDMPMDEAVDPLTVPAVHRKAAGQAPLSLDQVRAPRADSISDKRNLAQANGNKDLDDLARLAGITTESVSVIGGDIEGEMGGEECEDDSKMNISTNQSSDGTKSITVTADGEAAVALLDMLKNAGMGGSDAAAEQEVIIANQGDEHMGDEMSMDDGSGEMEMEEEYANEPAPAYQSVDAMMSRGDDMNREKKQNFPLRAPGNNPMAGEEQVNELSKNTLGSYAKQANAQRSHEPDDMKADRRGTGVMRSLDKLAGNQAGPLKGKAVTARFSAAQGGPTANKDRANFEKSVDRNVAKESAVPSMGRDLMAEYQAMKLKK